jgi:hypothetical protein
MRVLASFIGLFVIYATPSCAETVNLICGGVSHHYKPDRIDATVNPASTIIDLDNKTIETPVGDFAISKITPATIWFSRSSSENPNDGSIDRSTGIMTVSWYSKEDAAKKAAGLSFFVKSHAELVCLPAKRMF